MRILLALTFLAACSQEAPQVELVGEPQLAEMTYHCTPEGNEFIRVDSVDGTWQESMTGRACDYDAWRADVAVNGPVYSRQRTSYREWLQARSADRP